jgi:mRNA interferase MazF
VNRGEVWLADLGPVRNGEQADRRPVLIFQHTPFAAFLSTVVIIPFTSNLRRAKLPTCLQVARGEGGLANDSVALCHQVRAIDQKRLLHRLDMLSSAVLADVEDCLALTLGM